MAKPKLALIPSTVGGSVYSVLPSNGDGDFNFSRASAATRINAQGLIETVAVGDNRLNYPLLDGTVQTCPHLLLEGQRTNLITYSEDFSNVYWTKSGLTITSNAAISPDGTLNADKLVESVGGTNHWCGLTSSIASATTNTNSIYIKSAGRQWVWFYDLTVGAGKYFDIINGVGGTAGSIDNYSITELANGWFRISITDVAAATSGISIWLAEADTDNSYTGDGTSGVYIWGAQLEQGSYPTSYIPTSGSATTRIAEVCDGSGNASTFNDSEGVLMVQASALANDGTYRLISLSDNSANNFIVIGYKDTFNKAFFDGLIGGVRFITSEPTVNQEQFNKVCLKYKSGDASIYINGFKILSSITAFAHSGSPISELKFSYWANNSPFYGKTKQIQYFDSALTDSELETLTSWMSFSDMAIDLNYTIQ